MPILTVSDTALWVAYYRAVESERDGALFSDPFARKLAGEEGQRIAREFGGGAGMAAGMAVRTQLIDELVLEAVREGGVDLVINLACGLDARAYRLELPSQLKWIDVDLPALLEFKQARLGDAQPRCVHELCSVDLADPLARRAFLEQKLKNCRRALVLTEGLICYLTEAQVGALALDLAGQPGIASWVTDLFSPELVKLTQRIWGRRLARGNAMIRFGAEPDQFRGWGWRASQTEWLFDAAQRLGRDFGASFLWRPLLPWLPGQVRRLLRQSYSILLLERAPADGGTSSH